MNTIKKLFLFLLLSLSSSPLFSQDNSSIGFHSQTTEIDTFVKEVHEAGNFLAAVQSADGGYVSVTTSYIVDTSVLVRKIKASGQKEWERRLDFHVDTSFPYPSARVHGIVQTTDGGFVLAGEMGCDYGCWDNGSPLLIKLQSNGNVEWKKSFALHGVQSFVFSSVNAMPDGGVIATGKFWFGENIENSFLVVRFTPAGDVIWTKSVETYPDTNVFWPHSTAKTANGFILAFAMNKNATDPKGVDLLKITDSGNVAWEKRIFVEGFLFQSIGTTAESGIILIGTIAKSKRLKVVVLKKDGTLHWKGEYSLRVPGNPFFVSSPMQMPDGEYAIAGSSYEESTKRYYGFIAKIDSSGKIVLQNAIGDGEIYLRSGFATGKDGFVLFGGVSTSARNENVMLVLKMNSEGLVPGCPRFETHQLGSTTSTPFGPLRIAGLKSKPSSLISLAPQEFQVDSFVTNFPVSTLCH